MSFVFISMTFLHFGFQLNGIHSFVRSVSFGTLALKSSLLTFWAGTSCPSVSFLFIFYSLFSKTVKPSVSVAHSDGDVGVLCFCRAQCLRGWEAFCVLSGFSVFCCAFLGTQSSTALDMDRVSDVCVELFLFLLGLRVEWVWVFEGLLRLVSAQGWVASLLDLWGLWFGLSSSHIFSACTGHAHALLIHTWISRIYAPLLLT